MESMEPMDIDWNRVVSRFVRDETYEGIEAPHWADLTDPEARTAAVDDDAWFCRPGMYDSAPFPARARVSCCLVAPLSLSLSLPRGNNRHSDEREESALSSADSMPGSVRSADTRSFPLDLGPDFAVVFLVLDKIQAVLRFLFL